MSARSPRRWVTAAELSDFAYCPRSHYYARTRAEPAQAASELARRTDGSSAHARRAAAVARRAGAGTWYYGALVAAVLLLALAAAFGGPL